MSDHVSHTSWQLARLAEVVDPDAHDGIGFEHHVPVSEEGSPGAKFLRRVEYAAYVVVGWLREQKVPAQDANDNGRVSEAADGAVPVYIYERWQVFTDLGAWDEDTADYGEQEDMTASAAVALCIIAERLILAIIEEEIGSLVKCDRCSDEYDESTGDGYCGLCPKCADETEVDVVDS